MRMSAAKADAKTKAAAQREKAHEANEAEKRRAHELKIAMLQAGAADPPDEEDDEFKQRRPENNAQMGLLAQRRQTEARQREADRKQRLSIIDVPSNEARQQLVAAAEAMKRPSGTTITGPDKKTAEKIRRAAVIAERSLNTMQDAAAA